MDARPSDDELVTLGLYDPDAPDAADQLRLLNDVFDLAATLDEVVRAARTRSSLGPLFLDRAMRPSGQTLDLATFVATEPDGDLVRRIWSALGFPDSESPIVRVTPMWQRRYDS